MARQDRRASRVGPDAPPSTVDGGASDDATVFSKPGGPSAVPGGASGAATKRSPTAYAGIAVGLAVLVLVLVFIIQNLRDASVHYLGLRFRLPIGLLILAAAVAGGLIVFVISLTRSTRLRFRARRQGGRRA